MRKAKGKVDKRSGEWKVKGLSPEARTRVRTFQPFYRKRGNGPHRRHPLWVLDELRNLDRHRRLTIAPVMSTGFGVELTFVRRTPAIAIIRQERRKFASEHGAIVERVWLTPGTTQAEVRVDATAVSKLVLDEPTIRFGQRGTALIETLEWFVNQVQAVLESFLKFEPDTVKEFYKRPPFIDV